MSANQIPIWILKWRLPPRGRGRKHMAVFLPNPNVANQNPLAENPSINSKGLIIHAVGSPQTGYSHEFKRNYDCTASANVESAVHVGWVRADLVPVPQNEKIAVENDARGWIDTYALHVRPPGASPDLTNADTIRDCQDWACDFFVYLVQKRVVSNEVLQAVTRLRDQQVAYMAPQGRPAASTAQPGPSTQPTATPQQRATTAQPAPQVSATAGPASQTRAAAVQHGYRQPAAAAAQPASRQSAATQAGGAAPRVGASEWDSDRRIYKRYNYATAQWELYNQTQRRWVPWT